MQTSMLYTMGMALDRAADAGVTVSVLVDGSWLEGRVCAVDSQGVVLEADDLCHAVVRTERIAAVKVHGESPYRSRITRSPFVDEPVARPMAGVA